MQFKPDNADSSLICDRADIELRLAKLKLTRAGLAEVAKLVVTDGDNATAHSPANAVGMYRYMTGVRSLRDTFVDDDNWSANSDNNIEYLESAKLKLRVGYSNVHKSCDMSIIPQSISPKGRASEAQAQVNSSMRLGLPYVVQQPLAQEWSIFYLLVDENGAAELSMPIIENGAYIHMVERIWIVTPDELESDDVVQISDPENDSEIDVFVERKSG